MIHTLPAYWRSLLEEILGQPRAVAAVRFGVGIESEGYIQKHTNNAVSKTVNLPESATIDDVRTIYELAYRLRCKGITVFRYGSR